METQSQDKKIDFQTAISDNKFLEFLDTYDDKDSFVLGEQNKAQIQERYRAFLVLNQCQEAVGKIYSEEINSELGGEIKPDDLTAIRAFYVDMVKSEYGLEEAKQILAEVKEFADLKDRIASLEASMQALLGDEAVDVLKRYDIKEKWKEQEKETELMLKVSKRRESRIFGVIDRLLNPGEKLESLEKEHESEKSELENHLNINIENLRLGDLGVMLSDTEKKGSADFYRNYQEIFDEAKESLLANSLDRSSCRDFLVAHALENVSKKDPSKDEQPAWLIQNVMTSHDMTDDEMFDQLIARSIDKPDLVKGYLKKVLRFDDEQVNQLEQRLLEGDQDAKDKILYEANPEQVKDFLARAKYNLIKKDKKGKIDEKSYNLSPDLKKSIENILYNTDSNQYGEMVQEIANESKQSLQSLVLNGAVYIDGVPVNPAKGINWQEVTDNPRLSRDVVTDIKSKVLNSLENEQARINESLLTLEGQIKELKDAKDAEKKVLQAGQSSKQWAADLAGIRHRLQTATDVERLLAESKQRFAELKSKYISREIEPYKAAWNEAATKIEEQIKNFQPANASFDELDKQFSLLKKVSKGGAAFDSFIEDVQDHLESAMDKEIMLGLDKILDANPTYLGVKDALAKFLKRDRIGVKVGKDMKEVIKEKLELMTGYLAKDLQPKIDEAIAKIAECDKKLKDIEESIDKTKDKDILKDLKKSKQAIQKTRQPIAIRKDTLEKLKKNNPQKITILKRLLNEYK